MFVFDETLKAVAQKLVANCRQAREIEGLAETHAPHAVSVEALAMDENGRETCGIDAIRHKYQWWNDTFTVDSQEVVGPFLHGADQFSVMFKVGTTHKESGEKDQMTEIGVYTVDDGKIVHEAFYYSC